MFTVYLETFIFHSFISFSYRWDDLKVIQRYINHGAFSYFLLFCLDTRKSWLRTWHCLWHKSLITRPFFHVFSLSAHTRERKYFGGKKVLQNQTCGFLTNRLADFPRFLFLWFFLAGSKLIRKCRILLLKYLSLKACLK